MIRLHPIPEASHQCPFCGEELLVDGWYIPGMRSLADLSCAGCQRTYYGDLPVGGGQYYPMLLDRASGEVHDRHDIPWFADWLRQSYADRIDEPVHLREEVFRELRRPVLLNCLDALYGHSLLKLLNAQYCLDHQPGFDLILLVPNFLRWMVPQGVAAVWSVDGTDGRSTVWNDRLARELHARLERFADCHLSIACSHPHSSDYDIERFTRVRPFPCDEWFEVPARPCVTFVMREDRCWGSDDRARMIRVQRERIAMFSEALRREWSDLDFGVVGLGSSGGLQPWMEDLRCATVDETTERVWCRRYARSHLVVGMHGSNMLLPSAHAAASIHLMPPERWGNVLQDVLFRKCDAREAAFRHRMLPDGVGVEELATVAGSVLRFFAESKHMLWGAGCRHVLRARSDGSTSAAEMGKCAAPGPLV